MIYHRHGPTVAATARCERHIHGGTSMAARHWQQLLRTRNDLTLTLARVALATVFLAHGSQKVFGWFGGLGFSGTLEMFERTMGIPPALTVMAMIAEVLGGLGLLVGLLSRIAAVGVLIVMIVAPFANGLYVRFFMNWSGRNPGEGSEYHMLAIALILVVLVHGAGAVSLDRLLASRTTDFEPRRAWS
jgi:putative oxidoreductase